MSSTNDVPATAADFLPFAREMVRQLYLRQDFETLFGAVIASAHLADWHFHTSETNQLDEARKKKLRDAFKEYDTLLDLANGLKHGSFIEERKRRKAQPSAARSLSLKRIDAWSGDDEDEPLDGYDHLGGPDYWIVQHGDRRHSVYLLCERFLDAMETLMKASRSD